jgi:hypothetical protein
MLVSSPALDFKVVDSCWYPHQLYTSKWLIHAGILISFKLQSGVIHAGIFISFKLQNG